MQFANASLGISVSFVKYFNSVNAIISVLSPIVIVIVALVYVRIKDKKYARRFTQNGCDVAEASDEEVVYQGDKNKYNPKHPYWPLFYMYGFYMLLLIVALYISACDLPQHYIL